MNINLCKIPHRIWGVLCIFYETILHFNGLHEPMRMLREYKNRMRSIYLCPTVVAERTKKVRGNTLDHSIYIYIYILLFLTPKQWHNLPSSSLSINAITCKAKYIYGTLFLSPKHTRRLH